MNRPWPFGQGLFVTTGEDVPSKIKHTPIWMPDPEKTTNFYTKVVGIEETGRVRFAVYIPDGYINLVVL